MVEPFNNVMVVILENKSDSFIIPNREIINWCLKNLGPEGDRWHLSWFARKEQYFFKSAKDAIWFDLVWS